MGGRSDFLDEVVSKDLIGAQTLRIDGFPDPALARTLSANGRPKHWGAVKHAKDRVTVVATAEIRRQDLRPVAGPVRLTVTWTFPERRKRDVDNLTGNGVVKAVIDCLVREQIIEADESDCVLDVMTDVRVEKGHRALAVTVDPVAEGEHA